MVDYNLLSLCWTLALVLGTWCVFPSFSSPRPLFPGHRSSFAQKGRSMPSLGCAARHRSCNLTDTRACVCPLLGDIFSHVFIRNSDGFHPSEMSQVLDSPLSLWWKCLPFSYPSPLNLSVPSVYCQCWGIFIPFIFIMMKRTGNERIRFAIFVAFLSVQFSGNKSTHILVHPSPPSSSRSPSLCVDWALYPLIKGHLSPLTPCPWGPPFYFRSLGYVSCIFVIGLPCFFSLSLVPLCFLFIRPFQFFREVLALHLKLWPPCKIHKPGARAHPTPITSTVNRLWSLESTSERCSLWGISVPWPGIEPRPWHWNHWVLTTGPPGNFPEPRMLRGCRKRCFCPLIYIF